ncbi:MAG: AAA family ATPase [Caldilineaceae bacterium]
MNQARSVVICPVCQQVQPFRFLPLLIVCGPSGVGKSTACAQLAGTIPEAVLLEGDILWQPAFNQPETLYRTFFETWLRLAKNISQSGRPVVLFIAGGIPENIEPCVEVHYFAKVCYLALICEEAVLRERLQQRPAWRMSSQAAFMDQQVRFNQQLLDRANTMQPPVDLLDTSTRSVAQAAHEVAAWIRKALC